MILTLRLSWFKLANSSLFWPTALVPCLCYTFFDGNLDFHWQKIIVDYIFFILAFLILLFSLRNSRLHDEKVLSICFIQKKNRFLASTLKLGMALGGIISSFPQFWFLLVRNPRIISVLCWIKQKIQEFDFQKISDVTKFIAAFSESLRARQNRNI
jgi:hypothetical protein